MLEHQHPDTQHPRGSVNRVRHENRQRLGGFLAAHSAAKRTGIAALLTAALFLGACSSENEPTPNQLAATGLELPDTVGFNEHIRPIFAKNCSACHGGVMKSGGLSYVFEDEAITKGLSGNQAIAPGDPDGSYLITKITSTDPNVRMPPPDHGPTLKDREIALLKQWIKEGAAWEEHWALQPASVTPREPVATPNGFEQWPVNTIDEFVLDRLNQEGLAPQPEADKAALFRRVNLDLTGVPPTLEELDTYLADDSPDAYEQAVDSLLASQRYGERWATLWLDLARYADSRGAGIDKPRTIYKYRDWVIRAFNADTPFDDFTIKQIAGDLLPNATLDDHLATAYHRNTHTEDEGGTSDEEFRTVAVMDRVNTTWQAWHGTTFACVQCHSHPYDAFRHDEYFKFLAFFNNTQDGDTNEDYPNMSFPVSEERQAEVSDLVAEERQIRQELWQAHADLNDQTHWQWLSGMQIKTTKAHQMQFDAIQRDGRQEFVFSGTPSHTWTTIEADAPAFDGPVQALRMDVLPENIEAAPYAASPGFRISKLTVKLIRKDAAPEDKPQELEFDWLFQDEPFSFFWPNVKKNTKNTGFAAYTYIFRPRWGVFRFKEPVAVNPGDRFQVAFSHGHGTGMKDLLLARRGSIGFTDNANWRTIDKSEQWTSNNAKRSELQAELREGKQVQIPVMAERPDHLKRGTKVFVRGNWTDLDKPVEAATPASMHPLPDTNEPDRLRVARWLVDEENPLTARVLVSRLWAELFGTGLVQTLEDFGSVGDAPSHPQLLDYLALRLMHDHQWRIKPLLKDIVMSATYRQSSVGSQELIARDPKNRLLARGPRNRMTGEMIRDQVLAIAGTLNEKMYGPAVEPSLPDGGFSPINHGVAKWNPSPQDEQNRRSIYVRWHRSSIYPMFAAFDAPTRELCTDRRITSNTPVQPLFTLNDPALFKATQKFSEQMRTFEGSLPEQIAHGYRAATSQLPSQAVAEELAGLYTSVFEAFPDEEEAIKAEHERLVTARITKARNALKWKNKKAIDKAEKDGKEPPTDLPDPYDIQRTPEDEYTYTTEKAAFDAVATVILNLDAVLTK